MKFDFRKKDYGSICCFQAVDERLLPKREPDYISYADKFVTFDTSKLGGIYFNKDGNLCGAWDKNEDGTVTNYVFIQEIMGKFGDWGYMFAKEEAGSCYWYTKHGVYRRSDHWGSVGKSKWGISKQDAVAGYANYTSFIPKNGKVQTKYVLCINGDAYYTYEDKEFAWRAVARLYLNDANIGNYEVNRYTVKEIKIYDK